MTALVNPDKAQAPKESKFSGHSSGDLRAGISAQDLGHTGQLSSLLEGGSFSQVHALLYVPPRSSGMHLVNPALS